MIAKAGLGLVGLGAIGIGGVAFTKPEWLGINKEISWTPLSADHDFSSQSNAYQNTKFGGKYKDYLVGVVGNEKDKHLNKVMWEKLLKRWDEQKPGSGKFSGASVKGAYSESAQAGSSNPKALNRVCEDAYKTEITSFGTGDDKFKKDEVWKFCSPGTLITLINESHGNDTIGSDETNKKSLVSVESKDNDWFWKIRNEDFWKSSGDWSGSGATENGGNKSIFKTEYDKNNQESNKTKRQTVKDLCKEAYKLKKGEKANDNNDAQKFCKLETGS